MKSIKKIFVWFCGISAILFALLLVTLLFVPYLINIDAAKETVINSVSKSMGGQIQYQRADVIFLPRPHVVISDVKLLLPDRFSCSVSQLKVYPEVMPLFKGRVQFAEIGIEAPQFTFPLSVSSDRRMGFSTGVVKETVLAVLNQSMFQQPGLALRIENGRLKVIPANAAALDVSSISALIKRGRDRIQLKIGCNSNVFGSMSLTAQIDPENLRGYGQVRLRAFKPHMLMELFAVEAPIRASLSLIDLVLDYKSSAFQPLRVDFQGSRFNFDLARKSARALLKGNRFKGVFRRTDQVTLVSINDLDLEQPRLNMSGSLYLNRERREIRIDLSGLGVHVDPLREFVLAMAGDSESVKQIFEVIAGGYVPIVSINARGATIDDFDLVKNYTVKGNISNGRIHIPGIDFDLDNVKGTATIDNGVLIGEDLQAQLGNSFGYDGRLELGLTLGNPRFRLTIDTMADMAELQPVLMKLVGNQAFRKELSLLNNIQGNARGTMILGDSLNDISVEANVAYASLITDYARLPYPIMIRSGSYRLEKNGFELMNIDAEIGNSTFAGVSGKLTTGEEYRLVLNSRKASVSLPDLFGWLKSFAALRNQIEPISRITGRANLQDLYFSSRLPDLSDCKIKALGEVERLNLSAALFPDSVSADTLKFSGSYDRNTGAEIVLRPTQLLWGKSRLDISGAAEISGKSAWLDVALDADRLEWEKIEDIDFGRKHAKGAISSRSHPLSGIIRVRTERFTLGNLDWIPVRADIHLTPADIDIQIHEADLCGVSFPGSLRITPKRMFLNILPASHNGQLAPTVTCLVNQDVMVTGEYEVSGRMDADIEKAPLVKSITGNLQFLARSGRIYRYNLLAKILALINFTEIFRGKLPDIAQEGFAYESMTISGKFKNGIFELDEGVIDASSMTIVYRGSFDLLDESMRLTVLVAPFKTVDNIVASLPLLRDIFGDRLVSIPFSVIGKWSDYKVTPLSTAEVNPEIQKLIEHRMNGPVEYFQPIGDR